MLSGSAMSGSSLTTQGRQHALGLKDLSLCLESLCLQVVRLLEERLWLAGCSTLHQLACPQRLSLPATPLKLCSTALDAHLQDPMAGEVAQIKALAHLLCTRLCLQGIPPLQWCLWMAGCFQVPFALVPNCFAKQCVLAGRAAP